MTSEHKNLHWIEQKNTLESFFCEKSILIFFDCTFWLILFAFCQMDPNKKLSSICDLELDWSLIKSFSTEHFLKILFVYWNFIFKNTRNGNFFNYSAFLLKNSLTHEIKFRRRKNYARDAHGGGKYGRRMSNCCFCDADNVKGAREKWKLHCE